MTDQYFIEAITENPDSLEPRMVYADWLQEQGNPRGEFINAQIALSELPIDHLDRGQLESKELGILRQYQKGWARPVRRFVKRWHFRNGFIERVSLDTREFLRKHEVLFASTPIHTCDFLEARGLLESLANCPSTSRLRGVGLNDQELCLSSERRYDYSLNPQPLIEFLRSSAFVNLDTLEVRGNVLQDEVVDAIIQSNFRCLKRLDISRNSFTNQALTRLLEAYPGIRHFKLSSTQCTARGNWMVETHREFVNAFRDLSPRFVAFEIGRRLFSLSLVRQLELETSFPASREISLRGNHIYFGHPLTSSLEPVISNILHDARVIDLALCGINDQQMACLMRERNWSSTNSLDISNNPIGKDGYAAVAKLDWPKLIHLTIRGGGDDLSTTGNQHTRTCSVGDDSLQQLSSSTQFPRLAKLDLAEHQFTQKGAEMIVNSPWLKQLYYLDLSKNQLGDEGARQFVRHGDWPMLAYLNLRQNGLNNASKSELKKTFGYKVLF